MKEALKTVFSPILNIFEQGEGAYSYKPSHRKILIVVGCLFLFLAGISFYFALTKSELGAAFPAIVFFSVSTVCIIVGSLGSDRAIAKIH